MRGHRLLSWGLVCSDVVCTDIGKVQTAGMCADISLCSHGAASSCVDVSVSQNCQRVIMADNISFTHTPSCYGRIKTDV